MRLTHNNLSLSGARRSKLIAAITVGALAAGLLGPIPSQAAAPSPHWAIASTSLPTYFKPGDVADEYTLTVMNDGGEATDGSTVTVADTLPEGFTATGIKGRDEDHRNQPVNCVLGTLTCTLSGKVAAGDLVIVTITVSVAGELPPTLTNLATASGGGAPSVSVSDPTTISSATVPFGLSYLATRVTDQSGSANTQAGLHPWQMTTSLTFNSGLLEASGFPLLNADVKDIEVALPPGLVGDPGAVPQCSQAVFETVGSGYNCPADTQVGVLRLFFYGEGTGVQTLPIYNIAPPRGQPAELGFTVALSVHIPMFFHVRSEGDYGLTAQLGNVSEADPVRAAILTVWGVPADPSHNSRRLGQPGCEEGCSSDAPPRPFLTLPSSCQTESTPGMTITADSWQSPGRRNEAEDGLPDLSDPNWATLSAGLPPFTGCEKLSLDPSIAVAPASTEAGVPTGYTVDLKVPQSDSPTGLATATLRDATVALPAGTVLSPGAADGLQACTDEQFARRSQSAARCPQASQIGTVEVHSPLLRSPLEGQLFVGQPDCAPCSPEDAQGGRLVRLFLQAQGSGVTVKLEGRGSIGQGTGSLTTTFAENPQLPFDDLKLTLNGGPRAPLANPTSCGPARTTTDLRPWSWPRTPDATPSSSFEVTGCTAPRFAPTFAAGTTNNVADAFSPFTTTIARSDGDQTLGGVSVTTPPGLEGILKNVAQCPEPQAASGACPASSQIGHAIVAAGSGPQPLWLPQAGRPEDPVFLTGPYKGAPFGLVILDHAEAGPFDLGDVVVRAAIDVDPHTARITIVSDPLPSMRDGVPLELRTVDVVVDRAGFTFNPTSCAPLAVDGTIASTQGAAATVTSRFQDAECAALTFRPHFKASTVGAAQTKGKGASLHVSVSANQGPRSSPGAVGETNLKRVDVQLPKVLPARLTTLQQACTAAQFETNPAGCPKAAFVGSAVARTPVLKNPLSGPAVLVSHGGAAFPDVVIVLQGEGVVLDLTGNTLIRHGITLSKFDTVPDAPVASFELTLPQGGNSALASSVGSLCGRSLAMPTTMEAQNGAVLKQNTKIAVTGCRASARKASARRTRRGR